MQLIFGTLTVDEPNLASFLDPAEEWLLLAGFPDPAQAGHAATNFILNVRHLSNGSPVAVTGTRSTIGTQPVIMMTDINAAGSLMEHAMTMAKRSGPVGRASKKAGKSSAKKAKGSGKPAAKKVKTGDQE